MNCISFGISVVHWNSGEIKIVPGKVMSEHSQSAEE